MSNETRHRLCIVHSFDPLSGKVGGVETFVRDIMRHLPDDFSCLLIGIDATGQRPLGVVTREHLGGVPFDFLPILHNSEADVKGAAKTLRQSVNLQFMQALIRHWRLIRTLLHEKPTSLDLQRVEFAGYARTLGVPFTQMLHSVGVPNLPQDSLLRRYRRLHDVNERIAVMAADRFLCVNPLITERVKASYPKFAHKIETQTTWVDTSVFRPTPYPKDGFKVAFAGRLDLFKAPALMFRTMAQLRQKLGKGVEFHYLGGGDPTVFDEFAEIADMTVLHGSKSMQGVAEVLANVHAGILTSEFEGMPFSVLESLGSGRPVCAIHLPQLEQVIHKGTSGMIVPRSSDANDMANRLADAFVETAQDIRQGVLTPDGVAASVAAFTPQVQLSRIFNRHRDLQSQRFANLATAVHPARRAD